MKKTRQALKPFAGVGVAYAQHEEAKAEGQHDDVPHENAPCRACWRNFCVFRGRRVAIDQIRRSDRDPSLARISGPVVPLGA